MSSNEHGYCPHCGANWDGKDIPEDIREHYKGTKWGRQIGVDGGRLGIYDGIVALQCPDCGKYSPRDDSEWALKVFNKFMEALK